jgi:glycosyltransferase involved in cell wall biosynthesis
VVFDIYGPMVDSEYWARLQGRIARMPDHITVTAHGALPHDRVAATLAVHDLFFLPTMGENFGHAINEALSSGLPVLISDTTPWRGLQAAGAGWDFPLDKPQAFSEAIENFARASRDERTAYRRCARALAERSFVESDSLEANRQMLRRVLEVEGGSCDLER